MHRRFILLVVPLVMMFVSVSLAQSLLQPQMYLPLLTAPVGSTTSYTPLPNTPVTPTDSSTSTPTLVPTDVSTSTPTPSTISTSTPTVTATSIPTPTSTAVSERACANAYPLGIDTTLIGSSGFLSPANSTEMSYYIPYSDANHQNLWQRRIYVRNVGRNEGLSYLGWLPYSINRVEFAAAVTGGGTLLQGFNEAPWPVSGEPAPSNYPLQPHFLNVEDWVYGTSDPVMSAQARAALNEHVKDRTILTLIVVDRISGGGRTMYSHVSQLGDFFVNGVGEQDGLNFYLDLVYLGPTQLAWC